MVIINNNASNYNEISKKSKFGNFNPVCHDKWSVIDSEPLFNEVRNWRILFNEWLDNFRILFLKYFSFSENSIQHIPDLWNELCNSLDVLLHLHDAQEIYPFWEYILWFEKVQR